MKHIVIIGNGISGISAARNIRKESRHRITVISAESPWFFSRTALMYVFMGHMKFEHTQPYENHFWKKNNINLIHDFVEKIDVRGKSIELKKSDPIPYDQLILAAGSKSNKFGWPGQDLKGVQGLYSRQDLDILIGACQKVKSAVVVGGGLIGIELTEMLLSKGIRVTMLVRESSFWNVVLPKEESEIINKLIRLHGVDLRLNTELREIKGDGTGCVASVITKQDEQISCEFTGLTVGVSPNIDFMKDSGIETRKGILVNEYLETNIPDVYAIGDCAEHRKPSGERRPVEQVWYTGRIMGETVAKTICGNKSKYQPGIWFNSAKFFDMEYQTYGWVRAELKENEETFFWSSPKEDKCIRFVFDKSKRNILGINVFGIRLRHEICERWIQEAKTIDYVLENLLEANFDPEFFRHYDALIRNRWSGEFIPA